MDPKEYKELHENFMKNNNGTTIHETFITIIPTYFTTFITINLFTIINNNNNNDKIDVPIKFLFEFFLIVFPIILNVTILNGRIWEIAGGLLTIIITSIVKQLYKKTHISSFVQIPSGRPQYLSAARATINLITSVCILAVDFKSFPRKLAKTETFGFGLMDTGVGLYVFSNGIISPDIYKASNTKENTLNMYTNIRKILINSLPLIILGLARFVITNEIDYQQHISEYGVHWNFFITLAFIKIFGTIIVSFLTTSLDLLKYAAITIMIFHEMTLQLGLANYVNNAEIKRDNIFTANREGIISLPGYISLYLASVYIGYLVKSNEQIIRVKPFLKKIGKLTFISIVLWKIAYVCHDMFGVSRRLGNMGYVIWTLSIGTTMITLFMLLELFYYFITFEKPKSHDEKNDRNNKLYPSLNNSYIPVILNAINYNGLSFFLAANLLTGLINLLFQTFLVDISGSIFILSSYMFVLCSVITFLYVNKIKLKAW